MAFYTLYIIVFFIRFFLIIESEVEVIGTLLCFQLIYCIRPNYLTVLLRFFKIPQNTHFVLKYVSTCFRIHYKKRSEKDLFEDDNAFFFLICFIKACVVGSHLNCIDKSMQFR